RHLPELYARDEFMARFLMLFESFWAPLEAQIDAMDYYLAPGTTPERLLPWLASWVGLALDARLPRDRQRALVRAAIWLHRRRGTRQALQQYLEIASGGAVEIVEHRAADFCLGPDNRLGPGVALGRGNRPHTFTVVVDLPDQDGDGREQRQLLESIVEAEKPAHTDYELIMGSTEKG
ncbi:MAG: phage tail protein, partial [Anaerolineae bacterium]